ncbi:Mg2+ transporter protein CorA-like/Zinc transport protein ZntB, partial [Penicillium capsulatum]
MAGDRPDGRLVDWLNEVDHVSSRTDGASHVTETPADRSTVSRGAGHDNSLSDILRNGPGDLPEARHLPDSHASSVLTGSTVDRQTPHDSLEDILHAPIPPIPSAVPISVPRGSLEQTSSNGPRSPTRALTDSKTRRPRHWYEETLDNASKVLDHIKNGNVRKPSRHNRTSIVCYDYADGLRSNPQAIRSAEDIPSLGHPPQNVQQRLLVVEDPSQKTINTLGETFRINPEFFEEHLLNSGYAGAEYDMLPPRTWTTALLKKSYVSMRWIRPVYRLPMYTSNRSMQDIVKATAVDTQVIDSRSDDSLEKDTELTQRAIKNYTSRGVVATRISTNIFRSEWALWTDPDKTGIVPRECGLEERVSVWKGKIQDQNCEIIIVLLDPLPTVEETHPPSEIVVAPSDMSSFDMGSAERGPESMFEKEEPLLQNPPWLVLLIKKYMERMSQRPTRGMLDRDYNLPRNKEVQKIIVKQIAPRYAVTFDLDDVFRNKESTANLEQSLSATSSTAESTRNQLDKQAGPINLVGPLFRIIKHDTLALLTQLNQILDGVETGILDDIRMEDRLFLWRQVISRAQRELPELQSSIGPFIAFINPLCSSGASEENQGSKPETLQEMLDLSKEIDQMCARLRQVSNLLTSNMGLLDSRRSIDEAHAVSRLTELAFLFVPLSFATSIFGMQIQPFDGPVPVRIFIGVAVGVTAFAYLVRMTSRSQWFSYAKATTKHGIQRYAESHSLAIPTRSIPTLLMLQWIGAGLGSGWKQLRKSIFRLARHTWALFGFAIIFIFLTGVTAGVPIAIVWARDMDPGTQSAVTIPIIMIVFLFVGVPLWRMSNPEFRDALPKRISRWVGLIPAWFLQAVIAPSLTAAVSLALIWTRPLAAGIKGALTAGIVIFSVLAI